MSAARSAQAVARPARLRRVPTKASLRYINRELSWLDWNARVLYQAKDPRNPLLERVKFLAIFASNLDEFFQVRVAGLRQQAAARSARLSPDGLSAAEQLERIRPVVRHLMAEHSATFAEIRRALVGRGHLDRQVQQGAAAPRAPARAIRRGDLPGPDAARRRPGPSVPVHQHAQPVDRRRPARSGLRRAPLRPGQGAAGAAPAVRGRAGDLGAARPDHRQQPRPALHRDGDHRRPPVPGHPQRRPGDRGGRGRRPAPGDRGGAPAAALRRGGPARGRAEHAARDAADPARRDPAGARGLLRGQRDARPDRPVADRRARPAGSPAALMDPGRARPPRPARRGRADRHVRRDPDGRHPRPPPVRVVRRLGRAVHRPGGRGSRGPDDQADPVPDVGRLADRAEPHPGRRARQAGRRPGRDQGSLRRGGEHRLGAQARAGRRPRRLRPGRARRPTASSPSSSGARARSFAATSTSGPATTTRGRPGCTSTSGC